MVIVVIPAVQFLCVVMAVLVQAIRKLTGGVSFEVNKKLIKLRVRLLLKIFHSYSDWTNLSLA